MSDRRMAGQATVELVAMLPLALVVALAVFQVLAAGAARELAGHAAQAGAVAIAQDAEPREAARAALPGWSRGGLDVSVRGTRVTVELRPLSPARPLSELLAARSTAVAGDVGP